MNLGINNSIQNQPSFQARIKMGKANLGPLLGASASALVGGASVALGAGSYMDASAQSNDLMPNVAKSVEDNFLRNSAHEILNIDKQEYEHDADALAGIALGSLTNSSAILPSIASNMAIKEYSKIKNDNQNIPS